ncbi:MAG: hypothetical protein KY476_08425 [Planctomycetes bacterium]|nr:hypothetical protein [Planctomycetota bacterium]
MQQRSAASILERVIHADEADLPADAARAILQWSFDDKDRRRMRQLVRRGNAGDLSDAEQEELEEYRRIGFLLDLVHAKARLSLRNGEDT